MTPTEYKQKLAPALKDFLNTEAGRQLIPILHQLAPANTVNAVAHIHYSNMERRAGYESCEKSLIFLSTPPVPNEEIEMTYGVKEKKDSDKK